MRKRAIKAECFRLNSETLKSSEAKPENLNLNEKCLLNYLCELSGGKNRVNEINLTNLLKDFGVNIKTTEHKHSSQVYEIIEAYEKMNETKQSARA